MVSTPNKQATRAKNEANSDGRQDAAWKVVAVSRRGWNGTWDGRGYISRPPAKAPGDVRDGPKPARGLTKQWRSLRAGGLLA